MDLSGFALIIGFLLLGRERTVWVISFHTIHRLVYREASDPACSAVSGTYLDFLGVNGRAVHIEETLPYVYTDSFWAGEGQRRLAWSVVLCKGWGASLAFKHQLVTDVASRGAHR